MAYGLVLEFEGGEADYWAVNERLGIARGSQDGYPAGLIVHAAGPTATGWVVTEVWDSKASQEAFMATRLHEALDAAGLGNPTRITETETVNFQQFT